MNTKRDRISGKAYLLGVIFCCLTVPAIADQHHAKTPEVSTPPPVFDDLGTLHHAVTTHSPEAQQYFDQGLRLVYAFNHDEAHRAFTHSARK